MTVEVSADWPMWGMSDDARPAMRRLRDAGEAFALATLYAVEGGAPRPPGSQMVIGPGVLSGFLSGGCLESDVASHAAAVIANGAPRRLHYGVGSPWADIRLPCGGALHVLVERVEPECPALAALLDHESARRPCAWISDGEDRRCKVADRTTPTLQANAEPFCITRLHVPPLRLIVVGSDPIALAITSLARRIDCQTVLISPSGPRTPPPIAGLAYSRQQPDQALRRFGLDPWTAVAVATHDLDLDEAALALALPSAAGYVGALGARRRLPERLARLRALGVAENDLARLHAPIGLPDFGKAPWQVALSVIAAITRDIAT